MYGASLAAVEARTDRDEIPGRKKRMDRTTIGQTLNIQTPGIHEAWEMVLGELRAEMSRALIETWVQPLKPLSYEAGVYTVGAINPYGRSWVEERLGSRISQLLTAFYGEPVRLKVIVSNSFYKGDEALPGYKPQAEDLSAFASPQPVEKAKATNERSFKDRGGNGTEASSRKIMLQRAYGSERAALIQPERGLFITNYLFTNWLPLLGHSAFTVILAARSMCYWNPMTGELRNVVETEMGEIAERAAVSVRTVKDVLNNKLVQDYFLRYKVRRVMTSNGVRTAGISLQVRMDDPLTPLDQMKVNGSEEEDWYLPEYSMEKE